MILQPTNAGRFISAKRLPNEYQEVEWIGHNNDSYAPYIKIDKVIPLNKSYKTKLRYGLKGTTMHPATFLSQQTNSGTYFTLSSTTINYNITTDSFTWFDSITVGIDYKFELRNAYGVAKALKDNVSFHQFDPSSNSVNGIVLFRNRIDAAGDFIRPFKGRAYYFAIDDVIDLIPCYRKADNVIGMYDMIGRNFYSNAGTGNFVKGNDIY